MASHYAELEGALDRNAFYRPRRYRAKELVSAQANPRLRIFEQEFPLLDASSNGASMLVGEDGRLWVLGAEFEARLMLHGEEAQRLRARVVRSEPGARGVRVAFALTSGYLDLDAMRRLDSEARLHQNLTLGPSHAGALVPAPFREAVADVVHFVQYYRRCLEPHEAAARARGETAVQELAARTYSVLKTRYSELRDRASRAAEPCWENNGVLSAAKHYTETMLTPLVLSAPMVQRAYTKPLGYPGDYQVMLYYYDNAFEGATAFAKVFHKLFVEHPLSAGVCTRKDFVISHMKAELTRLRTHDAASEFAVTSLGCGPAREVSDFIVTQREWQGPARWRLIDQEALTLQVAHESAQRALSTTNSRGTVECLNISFGQILKRPELLKQGGAQHLIYSTGLFDYLNTDTARSIVSALYGCLAPGGLLLIGNACGPNNYAFCPEFVLDWTLIYRTRHQMLELADHLPSDAVAEVAQEPGGAYWFLLVRKGAGDTARAF